MEGDCLYHHDIGEQQPSSDCEVMYSMVSSKWQNSLSKEVHRSLFLKWTQSWPWWTFKLRHFWTDSDTLISFHIAYCSLNVKWVIFWKVGQQHKIIVINKPRPRAGHWMWTKPIFHNRLAWLGLICTMCGVKMKWPGSVPGLCKADFQTELCPKLKNKIKIKPNSKLWTCRVCNTLMSDLSEIWKAYLSSLRLIISLNFRCVTGKALVF